MNGKQAAGLKAIGTALRFPPKVGPRSYNSPAEFDECKLDRVEDGFNQLLGGVKPPRESR